MTGTETLNTAGLRDALRALLETCELDIAAQGHVAMIEYVIGVFEDKLPGESASAWVAQWRQEWAWLVDWARGGDDDGSIGKEPMSFEDVVAALAESGE